MEQINRDGLKTLLIIYPNWLPSNAVGVQRVRLMTNFLHEFGWKAILVCVDPTYYEEEQSNELLQTSRATIEVRHVQAWSKKPKYRIIGDISLRAFRSLYNTSRRIINTQPVDFIWIPIPPFYSALLGRLLHERTHVPYAIDYIDPWVHPFPGEEKSFSRAWLASRLAKFLEPIALKKVSVISGVSERYYLPTVERNKQLKDVIHCSMPYGFDPYDYTLSPKNQTLAWEHEPPGVRPFVYAGAFLPKSELFIHKLFETISEQDKKGQWNILNRLYFFGTTSSNKNAILPIAQTYGIDNYVTEIPQRIPYLEVLNHLKNAFGVMAIGSTEAHYTASKIFQALLSKKPIFPVFHSQSSVIQILDECSALNFLVTYNDQIPQDEFNRTLAHQADLFFNQQHVWKPELSKLDQYSAKYSAKQLVDSLNKFLVNN